MNRWLFLWLWCLSLSSFALPPTKSIICISLIRQIQHNLLLTANTATRQVLREFQKLGLDTLGQRDASAAVPALFYASHQRLSGAGARDMGDRIQGMMEFNRESAAEGDKRFIDTISLTGSPARIFLKSWSDEVTHLDAFMADQGVHDFRAITVLNAFILANINWPKFVEGFGSDPLVTMGAGGLLLMQLAWKQDFIFTRPKYWDFGFKSQMQAIDQLVQRANPGEWAMLSKNFRMNPYVLKATRQGTASPELAQINTIRQTYSEALPIRDRLLLHAVGGAIKETVRPKFKWVGTDVLVRIDGAGHPELLVVVRGSEKGEPKFVREPVKDMELAPTPTFVPISIPGD